MRETDADRLIVLHLLEKTQTEAETEYFSPFFDTGQTEG